MNIREILILFVGLGLGLALGIGFWTDNLTVGEPEPNQEESTETPLQDASSFQLNSIQGSFDDLRLIQSDTEPKFKGTVTFSTPEESPQTIEVSYLDLESGQTVPIAQALTLLPEREQQSMDISVRIPTGEQPAFIRLQGPERGQMHRVELNEFTEGSPG